MNSEADIHSVLKQIETTFSALDFDGWIACFHSPCTVILADRIFSSASIADTKAQFQPMFDGLRRKGFTRTQLDHCKIRMLTGTTAIADTVWTRYRGEQILEQLGATYLFLNLQGSWKVATLTGYPAAASSLMA